MSGPIIRKYGFPNFEQIFGKRDLEHGTAEESPKAEAPVKDEKPESPKPTKPAEKE